MLVSSKTFNESDEETGHDQFKDKKDKAMTMVYMCDISDN